jgi:hypothetical protein
MRKDLGLLTDSSYSKLEGESYLKAKNRQNERTLSIQKFS